MAISVNGRAVETASLRPATLLVELLRDGLGLTGTNVGCDTAQCGACTVHVDGRATKACNVLTVQLDGAQVRTIEALAPGEHALHPLQRAFSRHHALQCGYCTPGMLMRAAAMRAEGVPAEPQAVREALAGNICRCTGYEGIVAAICEWLAAGAPDA
ncbi:(2Fe-2S)-binding protein [Pelomonas sp. KK5]|uniref:(2Fe-2S)-binding protein n=1 Tax=Pelomonas sp. KK5 TaxID=1855730 RepID=UPI00097BCB23|nr:(2Fe-2S)-binding protein [Pelomonas sp. KK5]